MEYIIRAATEGDAGTIHALLLEICDLHAAGRPEIFKGGKAKYTEAQIVESLKKDNGELIFVACDAENSVLGYMIVNERQRAENEHMYAERCLYIDDLCVRGESKGRGVGKALMDHLKLYAKEKGYHRITLNVWEFNESAIRFYEKNGMTTQRRIMEIDI